METPKRCPLCSAPLENAGQLFIDDVAYRAWNCETCVVPWEFDHTTFDAAAVFLEAADGRLLNPTTLVPYEHDEGFSSQL